MFFGIDRRKSVLVGGIRRRESDLWCLPYDAKNNQETRPIRERNEVDSSSDQCILMFGFVEFKNTLGVMVSFCLALMILEELSWCIWGLLGQRHELISCVG